VYLNDIKIPECVKSAIHYNSSETHRTIILQVGRVFNQKSHLPPPFSISQQLIYNVLDRLVETIASWLNTI
jgi:hypothetical protein